MPPVSPIIHHGHVFNNASKKKYRDTVIRRVDRRQIDRMQQAQVTMVATSRLPKILSAPGTRELANQGHDSHAISRSGQHRGSCFYRSVLRRFPRCSRSHFSSDDFSRFFLSLSLSLFLKLFFSALTENVTRDPPRDRRSTALLSSRRRDRGCTRPRRGKNHVKIGDNTRRIDGSV